MGIEYCGYSVPREYVDRRVFKSFLDLSNLNPIAINHQDYQSIWMYNCDGNYQLMAMRQDGVSVTLNSKEFEQADKVKEKYSNEMYKYNINAYFSQRMK